MNMFHWFIKNTFFFFPLQVLLVPHSPWSQREHWDCRRVQLEGVLGHFHHLLDHLFVHIQRFGMGRQGKGGGRWVPEVQDLMHFLFSPSPPPSTSSTSHLLLLPPPFPLILLPPPSPPPPLSSSLFSTFSGDLHHSNPATCGASMSVLQSSDPSWSPEWSGVHVHS